MQKQHILNVGGEKMKVLIIKQAVVFLFLCCFFLVSVDPDIFHAV